MRLRYIALLLLIQAPVISIFVAFVLEESALLFGLVGLALGATNFSFTWFIATKLYEKTPWRW